MKKLLEKRKESKKKKPEFNMQDSHKLNRLKRKWRRPRGSDSKIRQNMKGYSKTVQPGYGSPKAVKGLHKSGLKPVIVSSLKDLEKTDKEKEGAIIKSTVGDRKKTTIIAKAKELGVKILNIRDPDKYIAAVDEKFKARTALKAKKQKEKIENKKKEEKKQKKEEDKLAEKVISEEEKADLDKKEKDKLLTKKDI